MAGWGACAPVGADTGQERRPAPGTPDTCRRPTRRRSRRSRDSRRDSQTPEPSEEPLARADVVPIRRASDPGERRQAFVPALYGDGGPPELRLEASDPTHVVDR